MIAIVDDGSRLSRALARWLDLHDLRVTHHRSAESLLRALHKDNGRLTLRLGIIHPVTFLLAGAVVDLDLPGMSGLDLIHALRRLASGLPLALIANRREESWPHECQPPADVLCLRKPLDLEALEETLFPSAAGNPARSKAAIHPSPKPGATPARNREWLI